MALEILANIRQRFSENPTVINKVPFTGNKSYKDNKITLHSMGLDEAVENLVQEYGLQQTIVDKRPTKREVTGYGALFTLTYWKELPLDGFLGYELREMVANADHAQRQHYFEQGPYSEFLRITIGDLEVTANYQIGKQGKILSQSLRMDIHSLGADAWVAYLKQSDDINARKFCDEWNKRENNESPKENLVYSQMVAYTSNIGLLRFISILLEKK